MILLTELGQCKARPFNFEGVYFLFLVSVPQHIMLSALLWLNSFNGVFMPAWVVFLLLQTLCDSDGDCKANPFAFIITISALAYILPAKCLPYAVYFM